MFSSVPVTALFSSNLKGSRVLFGTLCRIIWHELSPSDKIFKEIDLFAVRLGEATFVKISTHKNSARPGLKSMSVENRGCRFASESEGLKVKCSAVQKNKSAIHCFYFQMFHNYSKAACQFECMLGHASQVCGCTPWNFPFPPGKVEKLISLYF